MGTSQQALRPVRFLIRLAIALVLALGVSVAVQGVAAEKAHAAGPITVSLTIYDSTENHVLCNKTIRTLSSANTVEDMLAEAGFTGIPDKASYSGNQFEYFVESGAPCFKGKGYDALQNLDWVAFINGQNAMGGANLAASLKGGTRYQYVYTGATESHFEYTANVFDPLEPVDVALTVYDRADGLIVSNTRVSGMTRGDTVKSMLSGFNFTEVPTAADCTDRGKYYQFSGWPYFLGKGYDPVTGNTWDILVNSDYTKANWAQLGASLENGARYQYIYGAAQDGLGNPVFAPNVLVPDPMESPALTNLGKLLCAFGNRFSHWGAFSGVTPDTYEVALAYATLGEPGWVNAGTLIHNTDVAAADPATTAGQLARSICAMERLGIDASNIYGYDFITDLEGLKWEGADELPYIMLPYFGARSIGAGAPYANEAKLAAAIRAFEDLGKYPAKSPTVELTAAMVQALSVDLGTKATHESVERALNVLLAVQNNDGGFPAGMSGASDVHATAEVVSALISVGVNPQSDIFTTPGGYNPVDFLMVKADATYGTYTSAASPADEPRAAAAAFNALARVYTTEVYDGDFRLARPSSGGDGIHFDDVPEGAWFHDYVYTAVEMGMIRGYTPTHFGAGDDIKRCDVAVIMYRYSHPGSTDTTVEADYAVNTSGFSDVPDKMYFTAAMNWAKTQGIMTGDGGKTTVRPNDSITRQEMAVMLARYAKSKGENITAVSDAAFKATKDHATVSSWAREALTWTAAKDILSGKVLDDGKYIDPWGNTKREEAAKMLVVLFKDVLP